MTRDLRDWEGEQNKGRSSEQHRDSTFRLLEIEELETRLHEGHFPVDTAVEKSKEFEETWAA